MDRARNPRSPALRSGSRNCGHAGARLTYVLDASVAAAWYVPSQSTARALALLAVAQAERWVVPHCFGYEMPNLLLREERKGQIVEGATEAIMGELNTLLPMQILDPPDRDIVAESIRFARAHRISLFDALYARSAYDADAVLASRDGGLLAAAVAMGCAIYDARDR